MLYHKYNSPRNYYPVYFVFNRMNWVVVLNCLGEWPSILIFVSRNSAVRLTKPPQQNRSKTCNNCVSSDPTLSIIHGAVKAYAGAIHRNWSVWGTYSLLSADMIPSEWVQFNSIIFTGYYIISILTPPLPPHIYSNEKVKQGSDHVSLPVKIITFASVASCLQIELTVIMNVMLSEWR